MVIMKPSLKPVKNQVVVITGASSGIGRLAAIRFAELGAKLVLCARSEVGLQSVLEQIRKRGGTAVYKACDIADYEQVKALGSFAIQTYGRIDTWINNASTAVFARIEETTPEEFKRVMEVNYLGYVHGSLVALPHLKSSGGSLIFISSVLAHSFTPYLGAYTASKHALTGYIDTLRVELRREKSPVNVVAVLPATINTPFYLKNKTKLNVKPRGPAPVYQPDVVVETLIYGATHRSRNLYSGTMGPLLAFGSKFFPGFVEFYINSFGGIGFKNMKTKEAKSVTEPNSLYEAMPTKIYEKIYGELSDEAGHSVLDWYRTHPLAKAALWITGSATMMGIVAYGAQKFK